MRAVYTELPGGFEHTRLAEVAEPTVGEGDLLVEIRAAALNPADRHLIEGRYPGGPRPPFIAGRDAAGVVVQPDAAGRFPAGTRVLVVQSSARDLARGTLCERQRFPASTVELVPPVWSWSEAAAAPLVFQTAWKALTRHGEVTSGHVVAVTGAGGGVGLATVQLALGLGASVVALSRSPEKQQRLRELGVGLVAAPDTSGIQQQIREVFGCTGADVVVDTVGGPLLTTSVHLLGPGGRVSVLGVMGGIEGVVPIPSLMFKQASLHGILVTDRPPEESVAEWRQIVEVLQRSGQRPIVDRCFPLADYAAAFCHLAGSPFGKVVLVTDLAGE